MEGIDINGDALGDLHGGNDEELEESSWDETPLKQYPLSPDSL